MMRYGLCLLSVVALVGGCRGAPTGQENAVSEPVTAAGTVEAVSDSAGKDTEPQQPQKTVAPQSLSPTVETSQATGDLLFSCRTAQDKVIKVHDRGASIEYIFGPDGQPELVLAVPREQTSTYQWNGIGRYENYSVSIPNGDTVYIVSWARDRLEIEQPAEAGVSVEIDGDYVTTVDCATEITHNLIGVDLPATHL